MRNFIKGAGFCSSLFQYIRNKSVEVTIGNLQMGAEHPIRVQSMTTVNTMDTDASVDQAIKIIEAGGELVRITTPGVKDASNLANIKSALNAKGYTTPLVADIHFNPQAAILAAQNVEKVRVNPGNFADGAKLFEEKSYTEEEYRNEITRVRSKVVPFIEICKENKTAIRIGANHGSLSDRIMSRYGDTPEGMVESCLEYLRICKGQNFHNIVLSIKSSNTRVMVHTVRLLVAKMNEEEMFYPMHLGVTEAGNSDEGRIKSAVGIGALLSDGIGDTIRVSLTEDPECEIPVAKKLVDYISTRENHQPIKGGSIEQYSPFDYRQRTSAVVGNIGGNHVPVVVADTRGGVSNPSFMSDKIPEFVIVDHKNAVNSSGLYKFVKSYESGDEHLSDFISLVDKKTFLSFTSDDHKKQWLEICYSDLDDALISHLRVSPQTVILLTTNNLNGVAEQRACFLELLQNRLTNPVVIHRNYSEDILEDFQIKSGADLGMLFLDGFGDGIALQNSGSILLNDIVATQFGILQASRVRFSQTEFISCPGCGRTLFDLQETNNRIKMMTRHLKGVKLGIMGCIVNGPGEMADADYGYVGSGPGKVTLYRKKEIVKRNIGTSEAVDELIKLIKEDGLWVAPPDNL